MFLVKIIDVGFVTCMIYDATIFLNFVYIKCFDKIFTKTIKLVKIKKLLTPKNSKK